MASSPIPTYNPDYPALAQQHDWDCSQESINWTLHAWGRTPGQTWMEQSMVAEGVVSPDVGCTDASGAGLAAWVNRHYGVDGYVAANEPSVSFDDVRAEAGCRKHPVAIGGRAWYHWSGCRGYDAAADLLLLANPAHGWQGVYQTMNRSQWASLGPWSLVRVTHPAAEGLVPPPDELDYGPWEDGGKVGSGLISMMREDGVLPAQDYSTWLPLGRMPAQIEECIAEDGTVYRWLLTVSQGYRYRPE